MLKKFVTQFGSYTVSDVLTLLVMLSWAIACGMAFHNGEYLNSLTFLMGGILIVLYRSDLEAYRILTNQIEASGDSFVKASYNDEGVSVVAAGESSEVAVCLYGVMSFYGKFVAKELTEDSDADKAFKKAFGEMIDRYCEAKGLDKDEFAKRVGVSKLP